MYRFQAGRAFARWMLLLAAGASPATCLAYARRMFCNSAGPVQTWLRETFQWSRQNYWFPPTSRKRFPGAIAIPGVCVLTPNVYLARGLSFLEQSVLRFWMPSDARVGPPCRRFLSDRSAVGPDVDHRRVACAEMERFGGIWRGRLLAPSIRFCDRDLSNLV